jgi:hypothetical protein
MTIAHLSGKLQYCVAILYHDSAHSRETHHVQFYW